MNIKNWSKKKKIIVGTIVFLFFIGLINSSPEEKKAQTTQTPSEVTKVSEPVKNEPQEAVQPQETAKYEVVYTKGDIRYDGGVSYYVLIDPVNLDTEDFKMQTTQIIKDMISKQGNKISIEIYDDKPTLELSYKQYGDMSLGRVRTDEETKMLAIHMISSYDGDLETGTYKNTLSYFPGAFKDNPNVGKYVQTIEYIQ